MYHLFLKSLRDNFKKKYINATSLIRAIDEDDIFSEKDLINKYKLDYIIIDKTNSFDDNIVRIVNTKGKLQMMPIDHPYFDAQKMDVKVRINRKLRRACKN